MKTQITPSTKAAGLIGHPIEHSLSPKLHNALYQKHGIDCVYLAFDLLPEQLPYAVRGFSSLSFVGFNVTVPYKTTIMQYLDETDREAYLIGAVNTVKIENGKLIGYNTDGMGFIGSLSRNGFSFKGANVLLLGAGGSARSLCVFVAKEKPSSISLHNRTESNALSLAHQLNSHYPSLSVKTVSGDELTRLKADIIINTTSAGMWPLIEQTPLPGYRFSRDQVVVDIIYNPLKTRLLKNAEEAGCKTVNGLDMLVGQAVKAIQIWTGIDVDHDYGLSVLTL